MTTFAKQPFTFEQATKFIAGKKDLPTSMTSKQYLLQLDEQTRRRSFFSARVASADLLAELHDKVQGVVDGTMTDSQARELLRMFLAGDGKDLLASLGFSPPSADGGLAELGSVRRLQLIIDTNTRMAQEIGAFKEWQEMADLVPYGVWHLGVSEEHRQVHVAHDGKLFRYDHPIWRLDPPGGLFNCHCWREELTEDEAKARGLIPEPSNSPVTPSPLGFNPGRDLDGMFPIKPGMPPEIRKELDAILKKVPAKRALRKTTQQTKSPPTR